MRYCLDSSALIAAAVERYPPDLFPSFWIKFDALAKNGKLIAPKTVYDECCDEKYDDSVKEWVKEYKNIFQPEEDLIEEAERIRRENPGLTKEGHKFADSFVIAMAKQSELFEEIIVLTEEGGKKEHEEKKYEEKENRIKKGEIVRGKTNIPKVCRREDVCYTNLLGMMRREGWRF